MKIKIYSKGVVKSMVSTSRFERIWYYTPKKGDKTFSIGFNLY